MVAQAFEAYLKNNNLRWAADELKDKLPKHEHGSLEKIPKKVPEETEKPEDWQAVLYFLIHLVPVDAIAQLRHQLYKWLSLEQKPSNKDKKDKKDKVAKPLARLFDLYLDMHDAKFGGNKAINVYDSDLKDLFEPKELFCDACPEPDTKQLAPWRWRGLREILRFGDLKPLMPIFRKHPITDELNELEKKNAIARQQKKREGLHKKWEKKKDLSSEDKKDYREALKAIEKHRHLAAHVHLNNHARLHRFMMRVLGRLADYAGLWERDLFFVTLALINLLGKQPNDVFDEEGLDHLKNGQIVTAIRKLGKSQNKDAKEIFKQLKQIFGFDKCFLDPPGQNKDPLIDIRNSLMHFNMLQSNGNEPPNLTEAVNDTRKLMAYDRKLKNAVTRSIKEMLVREGLNLSWCMEGHQLTKATVKTRQATHLGNKAKENLHGEKYVEMVADLFGGKAQSPDQNSKQRKR